MELLGVQANGPPSDPHTMCQVTFHLLERSTFQILSEHTAADILVFPGRSPAFPTFPGFTSSGFHWCSFPAFIYFTLLFLD